MRRGYKPVRVRRDERARTDVDRTPEEFADTMGYGRRRYVSPDDFLDHFSVDWIVELRTVLRELLDKRRTIISVGSGECEHEVPLFLEGFPIVASDLVPLAFAHTRALFPALPVRTFDIFRPDAEERYDDVLITGLDSYFDAERARLIFTNARALLKPGGRLIFTLRYHDNFATRLIDYVGIPAACLFLKVRQRLRRSNETYVLKFHGYRRRRREIVEMARREGFRLGRVRYAGFGCELYRIGFETVSPALHAMLRRLDRRAAVVNSITVFEFLTAP